ncbi:MAG: flagellar hook-length control protein FliK, partial [Nitrosomonas sp.]|nr:flagellar hook-length control protein FliK [Nitrosomonas sp.]
NFNVLISGKLFQMHLPENVRPGDKIELEFLTDQPRLKFALQDESVINTSKRNTVISTTGQFLNVLSQETEKRTLTISPFDKTSIIADLSIKSSELPLLLQKTIQQSGLFYESHLAKWINGKHTFEALQQEPQGKIKTTPSTVAATSTSSIPVNAQSLSLVQQQLIALETNHIIWNGEIWNGQQIQWDIYDENATGKAIEENASYQWKTKLTMTLPELGKIIVSISLKFQEIQVSIDTVSNQTAQLLQTNQAQLKESMQEAGLSVQSLGIQHND